MVQQLVKLAVALGVVHAQFELGGLPCNMIANVHAEFHPDECEGAIDPLPCGTNVECPTCDAVADVPSPRVRESWHSASDATKTKMFDAMMVLNRMSTAEGQAMYGPKFLGNDYFVQIHQASVYLAGGGPNPKVENAPFIVDFSHVNQGFAVFHSVFVFLFEEALLAVDPTMVAMPYIDFRLGVGDLFGGGDLDFGSLAGTGANYGVVDGALKDWTVGPGDPTLPHFFGSLRGTDYGTNKTVRYPNDAPFESEWAITSEMYLRCASSANFKDFQSCIESDENLLFHTGAHCFIGGFIPGTGEDCAFPTIHNDYEGPIVIRTLSGECLAADLTSVPSGPNDPAFMIVHAFIAMVMQDFTRRSSSADFYGFQAEGSNYSPAGTYLSDVVGVPGWPLIADMSLYFDDAEAVPMTFADAICRFAVPGKSPYVSDVFTCSDDATFHKTDEPAKDCAWVAEYPEKRCDVYGAGKTLASEACHTACSTARCNLEPVMDTSTWTKSEEPAKNCAWVAEHLPKRCMARGFLDGVKMTALRGCPIACA